MTKIYGQWAYKDSFNAKHPKGDNSSLLLMKPSERHKSYFSIISEPLPFKSLNPVRFLACSTIELNLAALLANIDMPNAFGIDPKVSIMHRTHVC